MRRIRKSGSTGIKIEILMGSPYTIGVGLRRGRMPANKSMGERSYVFDSGTLSEHESYPDDRNDRDVYSDLFFTGTSVFLFAQ